MSGVTCTLILPLYSRSLQSKASQGLFSSWLDCFPVWPSGVRRQCWWHAVFKDPSLLQWLWVPLLYCHSFYKVHKWSVDPVSVLTNKPHTSDLIILSFEHFSNCSFYFNTWTCPTQVDGLRLNFPPVYKHKNHYSLVGGSLVKRAQCLGLWSQNLAGLHII